MDNPIIDEVLRRFEQLEDIERRRETATEFMRSSLAVAAQTGAAKLGELCARPEVRDEILGFASNLERDTDDFSVLTNNSDLADPDDLASKAKELEARHNDPRLRIAARFLGHGSLRGASETADSRDEEQRGIDFFKRPAEVVAEELKGKMLFADGIYAEITDTLPQDSEYNAKWANDPIFGPERVGYMVRKSRGNHILYLRAGDDSDNLSCVRITGIKLNGKKHTSASKVCKALGLGEESEGYLLYADDRVTLVAPLPPYINTT